MARVQLTSLLIGTLVASPLLAEVRQYGNVIYTVPEGWQNGSITHGIQLIHPEGKDTSCEDCMMLMPIGEPAQRPLPDDLKELATLIPGVENHGKARILQAPRVGEEGGRTIGVIAAQAGEMLYIVLATHAGDQVQALAFRGPGADHTTRARTLAAFEAQVVPMFLSARYLSEGAKPLLPRPVAGPLDGIWYGARPMWTVGTNRSLRQETDHELVVFWKDGFFYNGLPPNGLHDPDVASLFAAGDTRLGAYRVQAYRLSLLHGTGKTEEWRLNGEKIEVSDDLTLQRVPPLPDGARFGGRLDLFSDTGAGPHDHMSPSGYVDFRRDGTWVSKTYSLSGGLVPVAAHDDGLGLERSGTYEVVEGTLIRFDGAEEHRNPIFRWHGGIMIGTQALQSE